MGGKQHFRTTFILFCRRHLPCVSLNLGDSFSNGNERVNASLTSKSFKNWKKISKVRVSLYLIIYSYAQIEVQTVVEFLPSTWPCYCSPSSCATIEWFFLSFLYVSIVLLCGHNNLYPDPFLSLDASQTCSYVAPKQRKRGLHSMLGEVQCGAPTINQKARKKNLRKQGNCLTFIIRPHSRFEGFRVNDIP